MDDQEGALGRKEAPRAVRIRELARLFLKLGTIAFGGPAAHIAMMEDEVLRRPRWVTREAFLDLFGATNLIPGPNSTEMAIHIGYRRAGWSGLPMAGACFILPAFLLALFFVAVSGPLVPVLRRSPLAGAALDGVIVSSLALMAAVTWQLGRGAVVDIPTGLLALVAAFFLFRCCLNTA